MPYLLNNCNLPKTIPKSTINFENIISSNKKLSTQTKPNFEIKLIDYSTSEEDEYLGSNHQPLSFSRNSSSCLENSSSLSKTRKSRTNQNQPSLANVKNQTNNNCCLPAKSKATNKSRHLTSCGPIENYGKNFKQSHGHNENGSKNTKSKILLQNVQDTTHTHKSMKTKNFLANGLDDKLEIKPITSPLSRKINEIFEKLDLGSYDDEDQQEIDSSITIKSLEETPRLVRRRIKQAKAGAVGGSSNRSSSGSACGGSAVSASSNSASNASASSASNSSKSPTSWSREQEKQVLKRRLNRQTSYGANYGQILNVQEGRHQLQDADINLKSDRVSSDRGTGGVGTGTGSSSSENQRQLRKGSKDSNCSSNESKVSQVNRAQEFLKRQYKEAYLIENLLTRRQELVEAGTKEETSPIRTQRTESGSSQNLPALKLQTLQSQTLEQDQNLTQGQVVAPSFLDSFSPFERIKFYKRQFEDLKKEINAAPAVGKRQEKFETSADPIKKLQLVKSQEKNTEVKNANNNNSPSRQLSIALENLKVQEKKSLQMVEKSEKELVVIENFNKFLIETWPQACAGFKSEGISNEIGNFTAILKNLKQNPSSVTESKLSDLKVNLSTLIENDCKFHDQEQRKILAEKNAQLQKLEAQAKQAKEAKEAEEKKSHNNNNNNSASEHTTVVPNANIFTNTSISLNPEKPLAATPSEVKKAAFLAKVAIDNKTAHSNHAKLYETINQKSLAFKKNKANNSIVLNIRKTVNTPITNFSSTSGKVLTNQVDQLARLFNENALIDSKGTVLCQNMAQEAISYAAMTVIETLLKESTVKTSLDSKKDKIYVAGLAIASLWKKSPTFGTLFLSVLAKKCPQCLPHYPDSPSLGSSNNEADKDAYFQSLGFEKDTKSGQFDNLDEHKNKISGIISLYASICQAPLPAGSAVPSDRSEYRHPHGIKNLWSWLATTINSGPVLHYSAKLTFTVLEIAGYSLYKHYGAMFYLLLLTIKNDFIAKAQNIGEINYDVKKLDDLVGDMINQIIKNKKIVPHKSRKGTEFWTKVSDTRIIGDTD